MIRSADIRIDELLPMVLIEAKRGVSAELLR